MSLKIISLPSFEKDVKKLHKKFPSLPEDLKTLHQTLSADPRAGTALSRSLYKIRLANTSTSTGKSGGFRVIYYFVDEKNNIYLLKIFSKTDLPSISEHVLVSILRENGLE